MPRVSVIVPNYNHAPYLKQRIDSILSQTFQDFELILLDDCSTDNSREVLESYRHDPHVSHIVFNEKNGGSPFAQWNKGIELSSGEWIWIAESDDWAEKELLETLLGSVAGYENASLAYTSTNFVNGKGKLLFSESSDGTTRYYDGKEFITNRLIFNNPINNVSMVIFKKEVFKKINHALYGRMVLCGDWFFYVQMLLYGGVVVVNKLLNNYRIHSTNTSGWAESKGLTFMEGVEILDYIIDKFHIPQSAYSKEWGEMLSDYSRKYKFTAEVKRKTRALFRKRHLMILTYNDIYEIKRSLCSKR